MTLHALGTALAAALVRWWPLQRCSGNDDRAEQRAAAAFVPCFAQAATTEGRRR